MRYLILRTATRFLITLLLLFSVFLLVRGHNDPGGGFIGGLVAAAAFALYAMAYDVESARRAMRVDPHVLIAAGLLVALGSAIVGLLSGEPFLTGQWAELEAPALGDIELGTPLIFDGGVFLVVVGSVLEVMFSLGEE